MRCSQCHTQNREGARYCHSCGLLLDAEDGAVARVAEPGSRFCDHCGATLLSRTSDQEEISKFIGVSGHDRESEHKQATVLFADIVDSTRLIAGRDPEAAGEILNPMIEQMVRAVHAYGGTVCQIQGDGIMALFGAPLSTEDHAQRASYAALQMHASMSRAEGLFGDGSEPVPQVRAGISSGEVMVGMISSDLKLDYTAFGEKIHLGARLQQMADPGTTLCSADSVHLARGFIDARSRGRISIKGLSEPIEVFELTGAKRARFRFQSTLGLGSTPLLGRQKEYETLLRSLDRAAAGQGQIVAVAGEAGIGKSRLVWELTHSPLTEGWLILEAGGFSYAGNNPYFPIAEIFKTYFKLEDRDSEASTRAKVARTFEELRVLPEEFAPASHTLLGLNVVDQTWRNMAPLKRREVMNGKLVELLSRGARRQPIAIVVEDLHWTDNETREFIDVLVDSLGRERILLLVNYRPEFHHGWSSEDHHTFVRLGPLSKEVSRQLVTTLLGQDPSILALADELVDRMEGNPFYLEESIRSLIESKVLVGRPGAFQLAEDFSSLKVPASVHAVIGSRIDRLSPYDKNLLQAASAIGCEFSYDLLQRLVAEEAPKTLRASLARLKDAELLFESSFYPELKYAFTHALTQGVAYGSMLRDRRQGLHRRIVDAIEDFHRARLFEHTETLAFHATNGGDWEKAAAYSRTAGEKAVARSAYSEAVTHFKQSLDAMERLPTTDERLRTAIDIRFDLRNAFFPLGKIGSDLEELREAERAAANLEDRHRLAWVSAYIARDLSLLGDPQKALDAGYQALTLASEIDDSDLQALTKAYIGQAHYARGNYRDSADIMSQLVSTLDPGLVNHRFGLPGSAAVFFRAWLLWALARLGEFEEGQSQAQELIRLAAETDQPLCQTIAEYSYGFVWLHKTDFDRAIPILERSLNLCRKWGFPAWFTNIASSLGYSYACSGRVDEGLDLIEQAIGQTRSLGIMVSHANEVFWLAEGLLVAGREEESLKQAEAAVDLARTYGEVGNEADALRICGEVALRRQPADLVFATECFESALALAGACGMRPTMARCHLDLGRVKRRSGHQGKAGQHLAQASTDFRSLEMETLMRDAERNLKALDRTT